MRTITPDWKTSVYHERKHLLDGPTKALCGARGIRWFSSDDWKPECGKCLKLHSKLTSAPPSRP